MKISPLPVDEAQRLEAIKSYQILDTDEEVEFNDIVELASQLLDVPISLITIVDDQRQWFKAKVGLEITETHRNLSFCAHTIHFDDVMVVQNALEDDRFFDNPLVTDKPHIRFYAGMPLITSLGYKIGTLAVIDVQPRKLSGKDLENLRILARQIVKLFQLRLVNKELVKQNKEKTSLADQRLMEINNVFGRVSDGVVGLDENWRYTYVNPVAEEILGKSADFLIGKYVWSIFPENTTFQIASEKAMETQEPQSLELFYPTFNKHFDLRIYPSKTGLSVYFRDITKRIESEAEINKVSERASIIAKATNDIVWDWNLVTDEVVWNENYFSVLGYDPDTTPSNAESWYRAIHPEDKERVIKGIHEKIDSGENIWTDEYRFCKVDGTILHIFDRGFVMYDDNQKPVRIIGAMMDVTDRKKVEAKLSESESRLRTIIESEPECISLLDRDLIVLDINPAGVAMCEALDEKKVIGMDYMAFVKDVCQSDFKALVSSVFLGQPGKISYELIGLQGANRWVETHMVPLRNGAGEIESTLGITRDVTLLRKQQNRIVYEKDLSDSVINSLPGIFYLYDQNGKFLRWNKNFETVSGYSAEEISNMHPLEFFHDDQKELLAERIGKVLEDGYGDVEADFYTKDKKRIPHYFNGWKIDFEGQVCLNGVGIDITDKKKAEQALYHNWETYKNLFEANPLPMWIYDIKTKGFVVVNTAAIAKYGYSAEEFLSMSVLDIRPQSERIKLKSFLDGALPDISSNAGWKHLTKDGSIIDVDIYSHSIYYQGKDCRLVVANDVTEKKKTEEKYRNIFENTLEGIYQSTPDGQIIAANPSLARIYGFSSPEEMMNSVKDLSKELYANPMDRARMKKLLEKDGKAYGVELMGLKRNKEPIWVRNNMRTIYDGDGKIAYYEGTLEDITERKKSDTKLKSQFEELEKTNHELDRFVYSVSHDLRAPLASILGLINIAEMEKPAASDRTYLEMIRESVNRLEGFIKDILNYSRNSRLEIQITKIDWNELVDDAWTNLKQYKGAERLKTNLSIQSALEFYCDRTRLDILMNNLFSNSIKYQDKNKDTSEIDISIRQTKNGVKIIFTDNGIGIMPSRLDKIFDMFYRASDNAKGSGLGLYIAKETVTKLGGTIKVDSTYGHTTTFEIELPNAEPSSEEKT